MQDRWIPNSLLLLHHLKEIPMSLFTQFVREEEGATMVEYGLMLALIAVVCIGVVTTLGQNISSKFSTISSSIAAAGA